MQRPGLKNKDLTVETLRGIAIIMMVAGHVIGTNTQNGLGVEDDSAWRYFYRSFEYLRMPLFTGISGFVYSLRPIGDFKVMGFLKGKARRLLLPMISVGTLNFIIQYFVPGTNTNNELSQIWRIYFFPYGHFWFLQAIFLIFIIIALVDHFKLISTKEKWFFVFLLATIARCFRSYFQGDFFSFSHFLNLLPFFLLGCGIQRFRELFTAKKNLTIILVLFIISVIIQQYTLSEGKTFDYPEYIILSFFVASSGIPLLFYIRKNISFLSKLGNFAFSIYLFHVFGSAGTRIILTKIGIMNNSILFTVGLVFGLGVPVILEIIIEKSNVLRLIFLGLKKC
jgi:glucans biosynthesis protein C